MTYKELVEAVRDFERWLAPGGETELWGDFKQDLRALGVNADDPATLEQDCPTEVWLYWTREYERLEAKVTEEEVEDPE